MEYISTLQLISIHGNKMSAEAVQETLIRFAEKLPTAGKGGPVDNLSQQKEGLTVILTGSTGSLGSYLLNDLLLSPGISKIYCSNRRPDARDYQAKISAERGLDVQLDRVEFFQADLSRLDLGLQ
jgi:FlaA1/EpsC-like NDP-sugar epimerase